MSATRTDVVVIGAGISGLAVGARLRSAGIRDFHILEKATDLGGTWRENTYPGCACDIPAPLYSFSFDQNKEWPELFATQPDILSYLRDSAARQGLLASITFGTRVNVAEWDEDEARWRVETDQGTYLARFLVTAAGGLHTPLIPEVPGIENFGGARFHSASWDHSVSLADKHVAVIGTGASAIQFVPRIAPVVARLTIFQRTPPWIVPKINRTFDPKQRWLRRHIAPYRWWTRERLFWVHESRARGFVDAAAGMPDTERLARSHLRRQVPDEQLRAQLTPDYAIGCKRLLISSDYYPALTRDNVALETLAPSGFGERGVLLADGTRRPLDVLIYGTGFDAQNMLGEISISGRDGRTLAEVWKQRFQAYLGTAVHGFPNLFLVTGPNTGLGHNSQVFMIEAQAHYIAAAIRRIGRRHHTFEVRADAQERFNEWLDGRMAGTVWQRGGCRSWYQDPTTGRNTLLWPAGTLAFWARTRRLRRSDHLVDQPAAADA